MERLFTVKDVAGILHLHPETIRRMINRKELAATKITKSWRIRENDLVIYWEYKRNE